MGGEGAGNGLPWAQVLGLALCCLARSELRKEYMPHVPLV
jgi:hypothetical protein